MPQGPKYDVRFIGKVTIVDWVEDGTKVAMGSPTEV